MSKPSPRKLSIVSPDTASGSPYKIVDDLVIPAKKPTYPVDRLEPGQGFTVEEPDLFQSCRQCAINYARKHGLKFRTSVRDGVLYVKRES